MPPAPLESPYFTDGGKPRLGDAFVLFLDLLGTRGIRTGDGSLEHLRAVRAALTGARNARFCDAGEQSRDTVHWFSDNLAIGYPIDGVSPPARLVQLIVETSYLQIAFVEAGLVGRGAIARGGYFAEETFIYGPALERAVVLEHGRATHPRCVLDEASLAVAIADMATDGPESPWGSQLMIDPQGTVFVDYLMIASDDPVDRDLDLDHVLSTHRELIERNLYDYDGVPAVEAKYRWLAGYHNFAVERLGGDQQVRGRRRATVSSATTGFRPFDPAGLGL